MLVGNEETRCANVISYILVVSAGLIFAGGLFLPWYSVELGVFQRVTGTLGAAYRAPTIMLGALTFILGLLLRTELGPRLWRLPMALTVAGAALSIALFDITVVTAHLQDSFLVAVDDPVTNVRIGEGVWVVLIGAVMQVGAGLMSWGLERRPAERTVRA